jgi:hypothetical protein
MTVLKPGLRLSSSVCDGQIMILQTSISDGDLRCGGKPMSTQRVEASGQLPIDPQLSDGLLIGKRYVDSAGQLEVLCVRQGKGSLTIDGEKMQVKEAKQLPASD